MNRPIFITGIGTGIGKTVTSAVWVEKLKADYWKPIQSGDLHYTDTDHVRSLISNPITVFHSEAYRLDQPFSPHKSAALDGIRIEMNKIILPDTKRQLIIEGAGGLMVPLNEKDLMIDLIKRFDAEVVLVSRNYLGSINHTLMSLAMLSMRNIPIRKIVFCGDTEQSSEEIILKHTTVKAIRIPQFEDLSRDKIKGFTETLIL
jgi:dethiobiotin synthetase